MTAVAGSDSEEDAQPGMVRPAERLFTSLASHWRGWVLLFWLATCAFTIFDRWGVIHWFALPDTDDNMRIMQVRALLHGQGWYDLRQYRLDPPGGANIHWSRLVDLPIAGIILALRPFVGGMLAEKAAVATAPLLPMLLAMIATSLSVRRLVAPAAYLLALVLLVCAHATMFMWSPLRIDHHGWQLALLSVAMLSFTDPKPARGGALLGAATALCVTIGLEMLPYLAAAGAITVLLWVRDQAERPRLLCYGALLAGGTAFGYLGFASWDNQQPVCDALSPVWLSALTAAGAIAVVLALLPLQSRTARLAAAAAGGVLLAAGFAHFWHNCLIGRLEQVSPELDRLWLSKVREARPVYLNNLATIATITALPLAGLLGYAAMLWRTRKEAAVLTIWATMGAMAAAAAGLLLWQTRAGPSAQLLAVPGATALGWLLLTWALESRHMLIRVLGPVLAFGIVSGIGLQFAAEQVPDKRAQHLKRVNQANRTCPTLPALHAVAVQPKGLVLTFVDLGPRLITVTHHDAIAGPYHRNGQAILDVMRTFRGTVGNAEAMVMRRHVDYVLICPNLSESTIYRAEAPQGFYAQLADGHVPAWLQPVQLPKWSPYRMWRVVRPVEGSEAATAPRANGSANPSA